MFKGTATAIITPFKDDGSIDEASLRRLVDFQEENGVTTIVPVGSTGESATLSHEEHIRVIEIVVDQAKKAKILAGAGSNCTAEASSSVRHPQILVSMESCQSLHITSSLHRKESISTTRRSARPSTSH